MPVLHTTPTLTVVIPTYLRSEWLRRAVRSLARQVPPPAEVVAVSRASDALTREAIRSLAQEGLPFPVIEGTVTEPGFMPPVREGIRLASHDIVAVLDDDAEAEPGWTAAMLRHYADPLVGGVGGRCINIDADRVVPVGSTRRVGYVDRLGRFIGRMHMQPAFSNAVPVKFMIGGCMSFRASVARQLEFDAELNGDVAFGYEADLGLQVTRAGWKVLFDPAVAVRHYSAPRPQSGMRVANPESTRAYAFNHLRVVRRQLPAPHRYFATTWLVLVGERRAPGILPWVLSPIAVLLGFQVAHAPSAWEGRRRAIAITHTEPVRVRGPGRD